MPLLESGEETLVGGQAVMEGVMMRAPHSYCVAVRKPDGEMVTEEQAIQKVSEKYPLFKFPVLRGLGILGQAMTLGYRALMFSAKAALRDQFPASGDGYRDGLLRPAALRRIPGEVSGTHRAAAGHHRRQL